MNRIGHRGSWTQNKPLHGGAEAENLFYKALWPLEKQARRGFRGYPIATVAFYGPDDQRTTKVAVGVIPAEGAGADQLQRWFSEHTDVRSDPDIARRMVEFIEANAAKSVVLVDRIIGCPHEEGVDYPLGAVCPQCPFWTNRDRWSGRPLR